MSEDVWGQTWREHMGIPDVVVTGSFSPTTENISLMQRIWRATFADDPRKAVVLSKDMDIKFLTGRSLMGPSVQRCRYCKEIVHGDECKTCGAPQ